MLFNAFVAYRDGADIEQAAGVLSHYLEVAPEDGSTLSLRARLIRIQGRVAQQAQADADRQRALAAEAEAERERQLAEQRAEAERRRADEATTTNAATRQGWVIATAGAGLIVASGVLALIAKSRVDQLESECPNNRCMPGFEHDRDRARRVVIATDTLWMAGAVVAGAGLVLVLTADSDEPSEATNVGAFCDNHGCAASYRRRF